LESKPNSEKLKILESSRIQTSSSAAGARKKIGPKADFLALKSSEKKAKHRRPAEKGSGDAARGTTQGKKLSLNTH